MRLYKPTFSKWCVLMLLADHRGSHTRFFLLKTLRVLMPIEIRHRSSYLFKNNVSRNHRLDWIDLLKLRKSSSSSYLRRSEGKCYVTGLCSHHSHSLVQWCREYFHRNVSLLEIFFFQIKKAGLIREELFHRKLNLCKSFITFPHLPVLWQMMAYKWFRKGFLKGTTLCFIHIFIFLFFSW